MKLAIAGKSDSLDCEVSNVSGRAPYYLIFEDKKLVKTIKNPFMFGGGSGLSIVQLLYNESVQLIIAGNFGENVLSSMDSKGIKHKIENDKTISQILEEI